MRGHSLRESIFLVTREIIQLRRITLQDLEQTEKYSRNTKVLHIKAFLRFPLAGNESSKIEIQHSEDCTSLRQCDRYPRNKAHACTCPTHLHSIVPILGFAQIRTFLDGTEVYSLRTKILRAVE
jgi:hypothetical protein